MPTALITGATVMQNLLFLSGCGWSHRRVAGWVSLGGCLHTEVVYPSRGGLPTQKFRTNWVLSWCNQQYYHYIKPPLFASYFCQNFFSNAFLFGLWCVKKGWCSLCDIVTGFWVTVIIPCYVFL